MRLLVDSITDGHTDNHRELFPGDLTPWSLTVPVCCCRNCCRNCCRSSALGVVKLVSRAAAEVAWEVVWTSRGSLRDPTQSQYIKANVANSHRLIQIKLYNRNLLSWAFMAKKTSAVTTVEAKTKNRNTKPSTWEKYYSTNCLPSSQEATTTISITRQIHDWYARVSPTTCRTGYSNIYIITSPWKQNSS